MALRFRILAAGLFLIIMVTPLAARTGASEAEVSAAHEALGVNPATLTEEELQTAFRRMKRKADTIQFDLKTDTEFTPPPPGWAQAIGRFFNRLFAQLAPLFKVIFWMIVAGLAGLILYAIGTALWEAYKSRRDRPEDDMSLPEFRPSAQQARVLLADADALAERGQYGEAVHLLLYRSIQDIDQAHPGTIRLSMTSREIGRNAALGPQTRETFAAIAALVETSHFGSTQLSADDYAHARTVYVEFSGLTQVNHDDLQVAA